MYLINKITFYINIFKIYNINICYLQGYPSRNNKYVYKFTI